MISISSLRRGGIQGIVRISQLCLRDPVTMSRYPPVFGRTGDPIARALRMSQIQKMLDQEVLRDPVSQDPVNPPGGCLSGNSLPKSPNMKGPGVPTTMGCK